MSGSRGIARAGARLLLGGVCLAVAVALGAAAVVLPWPSFGLAPAVLSVAPVPAEQIRVCPGPLLTLAEDSTKPQAASSVGRADVVLGAVAPAAASASAVNGRWSKPAATAVVAADNSRVSDGAPLLVRIPVKNGATSAPLVAGSQSQLAASEVLGGFATAACAEATGEAWLVGGSTDVGHTTLVTLSNPTTVVASVNLTVFGESGKVDAPGSTGILVQPGAQRIVSLAGLAPNLRSPVVHMESQGGQVVATLQQTIVRGLQTGGVDLLGASLDPALEQSIAGLRVTNLPVGEAGSDAGGVASDTPIVRILAPGDAAATVQLGVVSEDGLAGTSLEVQVQPGIATDVPLEGLGVGNYSLTVDSDAPVVTSALASATGTAGRDFAWFSSSAPLDGDFAVATPAGPSPALNLVNQGGTVATYSLRTEQDVETLVTVRAGAAVALPLAASTRYLVSGGTSTIASVSFAQDGLLSSVPIRPPGPLAAPISVYPH
jgi:hypothetical protein